MVEFHNLNLLNTHFADFQEAIVASWLNDVVLFHGKRLGDLNVILMSDDELLDMNIQHLNHDYFTDIITFNYCEGALISGDLFISVDRVVDNANTLSVAPDHEFLRVVVHGVLHLIGFNDKTDEEDMAMRTQEDVALRLYVSRET